LRLNLAVISRLIAPGEDHGDPEKVVRPEEVSAILDEAWLRQAESLRQEGGITAGECPEGVE
jgi:hypothetical protein